MAGVIQDRYSGAQRDVGGPALVDFLDGWFKTRRAANEEAAKEQLGVDPTKLAEMELSAREQLTHLQESLGEIRAGNYRSDNDMLKTVIKSKTDLAVANTNAAKELGKAKILAAIEWANMATKDAEQLAKAAGVSDETAAMLDNTASASVERGRSVEDIAKAGVNRVRALAQKANAGGMGDVAYDEMTRRGYNSFIRAGQLAAAQAFAEEMQPGGGGDPNVFMKTQHPTLGLDEARERGERSFRGTGAGVDPSIVDKWGTDAGVDMSAIGENGGESSEESNETTGPTGSADAKARPGGTVSAKGLTGPGAAKFAQGIREGKDPYEAMAEAISTQAAYADSLAAERKASTEARRKSTFPRANPYLANPNTYVGRAGQSALRSLGENDPGLNEAWGSALQKTHGNVDRAYRDIAAEGGAEPRFSAIEVEPFELESGGDLGAHLASLTDPKEIVAILAVQPAEVQDLFKEARAAAASGNARGAAELAGNIEADETRAAFGQAMRRAEHDPEEVERIRVGIAALPDDVAEVFAPFGRSLEAGTRDRNYLATGAMMRGIGNIGRALELSGGSRERRALLEKQNDREEAMYEMENRAEAARKAGEMARETFKPIDRKARESGGRAIQDAPTSHANTLAKQETGRLQMEKSAKGRDSGDLLLGDDKTNEGRPDDTDPLSDIGVVGGEKPYDPDEMAFAATLEPAAKPMPELPEGQRIGATVFQAPAKGLPIAPPVPYTGTGFSEEFEKARAAESARKKSDPDADDFNAFLDTDDK